MKSVPIKYHFKKILGYGKDAVTFEDFYCVEVDVLEA